MADITLVRDDGRYALVQRVLHWTVALVVICSLLGGLMLYLFGFGGLRDTFGMEVTNLIYKYHKTLGVLVLMLMAFRIAARLKLGAPAMSPFLPVWQVRAADAVHIAIYVLLIAVPVLGWAGTAAGGFPVQFFDFTLPGIIPKDKELSKTLFQLHGLAALSLTAILVLHIGAAYRHWKLRDGTMARISLP
ncbi:MAG: cytochrome b [Pseudomonadota bacterium]